MFTGHNNSNIINKIQKAIPYSAENDLSLVNKIKDIVSSSKFSQIPSEKDQNISSCRVNIIDLIGSSMMDESKYNKNLLKFY